MKTEHVLNLILFCALFNCCLTQDKCVSKETCRECIRNAECSWCIRDHNSTLPRCQPSTATTCPPLNIINPKSTGQITENQPIQSSGIDAVQISPQKVKLQLRPGETYKLDFEYAVAKDYPVDLYYVMDLSASMIQHQIKLAQLGNLLAETMRNLTKDFKLGFGSYVDKPVMPFTSKHPELLANPCKTTENINACTPTYSFKNHLALTDNSNMFTIEVAKAPLSGNLDNPEGTLDAIMQAIMCKNEIGWRSKARHLIVISTDDDYHIAGDGKLGGIVVPNDGKCHMENGEYIKANVQDYPSIGHIASKVKEHNMNLIFVIASSKPRVVQAYEILTKRLEGSLGFLDESSSNVVGLIKDLYDKIVESVKISDNSNSNIQVKYFSTCRDSHPLKETSECKNLKTGERVTFHTEITMLNCPESSQTRTQTFQIKPGALEETLTVEIEMLCDCDCEKGGKANAEECNNSGNLQCGVCNCNSGKFGSTCQCEEQNSDTNITNCRINEHSPICSNLGRCVCNKCYCNSRANSNEVVSGKFCECTNYSCPKKNNILCSNNGECVCGKCICNADYSGESCQCHKKSCIYNGKSCNKHGKCNCDKCMCEKGFSGKFCEICPTCNDAICEEMKDCVECLAYKTGIYDEDSCRGNCSALNVTIVEDISKTEYPKEKMCRGLDDHSCVFSYKYYFDEKNSLVILAEKEKLCSESLNIAGLIGWIVGTILLAGLIALLIWKAVTTVYDRREYAKFENERKNAKWNAGENPLFKSPVTTVINPLNNRDVYD